MTKYIIGLLCLSLCIFTTSCLNKEESLNQPNSFTTDLRAQTDNPLLLNTLQKYASANKALDEIKKGDAGLLSFTDLEHLDQALSALEEFEAEWDNTKEEKDESEALYVFNSTMNFRSMLMEMDDQEEAFLLRGGEPGEKDDPRNTHNFDDYMLALFSPNREIQIGNDLFRYFNNGVVRMPGGTKSSLNLLDSKYASDDLFDPTSLLNYPGFEFLDNDANWFKVEKGEVKIFDGNTGKERTTKNLTAGACGIDRIIRTIPYNLGYNDLRTIRLYLYQASTPSDEVIRSITIDWGDGTLPSNYMTIPPYPSNVMWYNDFNPILQHEYSSNGTYTVTLEATYIKRPGPNDDGFIIAGTDCKTFTVNVRCCAPKSFSKTKTKTYDSSNRKLVGEMKGNVLWHPWSALIKPKLRFKSKSINYKRDGSSWKRNKANKIIAEVKAAYIHLYNNDQDYESCGDWTTREGPFSCKKERSNKKTATCNVDQILNAFYWSFGGWSGRSEVYHYAQDNGFTVEFSHKISNYPEYCD